MAKPKFPHMLREEETIWQRWLDLAPLKCSHMEYDVHVGEGYQAPDTYPAEVQRMAKRLTQKRIDAVCHTETEIWLIEIKVRATNTAVGQLLSYKTLYRDTFNPEKPLKLAIVARDIAPDMEKVFQEYGIKIFQV